MSNNSNNLPIGVFDSGVGGFTVVKALKKYLPGESIIYLGDSARVPYGTKSPETVIKYSLKNAKFLVNQNIKMLVIACNTASAHAVEALRENVDIPVLGMIEPGSEAALEFSKTNTIGIIGTLGTVDSMVYEKMIHKKSGGIAKTVGKPCPLFVSLAEEGWVFGDVPKMVATKYLSELRGKLPDLDTIVLGCTHYPLLRDVIQETANEIFQKEIVLIDSGISAAKSVRKILESQNIVNTSQIKGKLSVFVTDSSHISETGSRFLGEPLGWVEKVDI